MGNRIGYLRAYNDTGRLAGNRLRAARRQIACGACLAAVEFPTPSGCNFLDCLDDSIGSVQLNIVPAAWGPGPPDRLATWRLFTPGFSAKALRGLLATGPGRSYRTFRCAGSTGASVR
jgi:hypothetical protein